jgi:hypothetical protein
MYYLRVSVLCVIMAIMTHFISCTPKAIVDGEATNPPIGYTIHCLENPNSPFCKEVRH